MSTEVEDVILPSTQDLVAVTAADIAKEIHALRLEMNIHVDRIDQGLRDGDIYEANAGKRKLSGVVKSFGHAITAYQSIDLAKKMAEKWGN